MSTSTAPAIDMDKLNAFIGQFVSDLGRFRARRHGSHRRETGPLQGADGRSDDVRANSQPKRRRTSVICASGWARRLPEVTSPTMKRRTSSA